MTMPQQQQPPPRSRPIAAAPASSPRHLLLLLVLLALLTTTARAASTAAAAASSRGAGPPPAFLPRLLHPPQAQGRHISAHGSDDDNDRGHQPQRQPLSRALARLMPPAAITLLNLVGGGVGLLTPSFPPAPAAAAAATATAQSPFTQISSWTTGKNEGEPVPFSPRDGKGKRVQEMNRRFARQVWATIANSFYDASGGGFLGSAMGEAVSDPAWDRVWEEADRRGLAGGEKGGYGSAEGTREVCRFMVSKLGDEYSAYLGPVEVKGLVRSYPGSATGARRKTNGPKPPSSKQQQQAASTAANEPGGKAASASSGGRRGRDKADGGASLSASVGMQLEPASYCPPAALLQPPRFNAQTGMYEYPSINNAPSSSLRSQPPQSPFPSSLLPSRPCAVVAAVLPGSPAEQAGIRIGDRVARIGHVATENAASWDRDGIFENRLLRGAEGTSLRVELLRNDERDPRLERRVPLLLRRQSFAARHYPALAVQTLLDSEGRRVAYIRLRRFDAQATAQLRSVLYAEERVGASAYVLDLRNNMGGIFQESLKMAALFLPDPKSILCYTLDAWGGRTPHFSYEYDTNGLLGPLEGTDWLARPSTSSSPLVAPHKPVVLLVNKGSASSSEALAAALRDNGRAWLVGERTFGKSLIQHLFPLPDGGALKLTVAEYLTPKQRHLARLRLPGPKGQRALSATTFNAGLEPDVQVADAAPRPNTMDDMVVTQALELLVQSPFPPSSSPSSAPSTAGGDRTTALLSLFSQPKTGGDSRGQ